MVNENEDGSTSIDDGNGNSSIDAETIKDMLVTNKYLVGEIWGEIF